MQKTKRKPSCEHVYPDCNKYKNRDWEKKGCPCCGGKVTQWGVVDQYGDGFAGLQCKDCEWECEG